MPIEVVIENGFDAAIGVPMSMPRAAAYKVVACKREIEAGKQIVTDLERKLAEAESLLDFAQGNLHQAINQVIHHDHVGELLQGSRPICNEP
jgi:hypothetical protein